MAFLRSLSAGVSGLRNHQLMMDVIGNNIANINTIGFKAGRATFSEMFAQTLRSGSLSTTENGGSNPIQVGLGMSTSRIDTLFHQGNIESTDQATDLAIQGTGFFIVNQNGKNYYTRDGGFKLDAMGRIVTPGTGAILQGKLADANGNIPSGNRLENLVIRFDTKSPAQATSNVKLSGNLDASAPVGTTVDTSLTVFDSLGNRQSITITFTKTANVNEWTWAANSQTPATITSGGSGLVAFNADGTLQTFTYGGGATGLNVNPNNGASPLSIALNAGTPGVFAGITQSQGLSNVSPTEQDGYASGALNDISIDQNGKILGSFSNGIVKALGQMMLAEFNNPSGLLRTGDNMYDIGSNAGIPVIFSPGGTSNSVLVSGGLEQSNVDLADEFTKMITAQRGFQANARVITTSDEFLTEVVNIKR